MQVSKLRKILLSDQSIVLTTLILLVAPIGAAFLAAPDIALFGYFAGDAYTYLSIARNFSEYGVFTFDGEYPTNGFHPLWMLLLSAQSMIVDALHLGHIWQMHLSLLLQLAMMATGLVFLGLAFKKQYQRIPGELILLPLGFTGLCMGIFSAFFSAAEFGHLGTMWSMVNGLESSIVFLCYAGLLYYFVTADFGANHNSYLFAGLLLALLVLARLDHVFLPIVVCGGLGLFSIIRRNSENMLAAILIGLPILLLVGSYLLFNQITNDSLLPLSGKVKSTFPDARPPSLELLQNVIMTPGGQNEAWIAKRLGLLIIPAMVAVSTLLLSLFRFMRGRQPSRLDSAQTITAVFVLLLASYNWFFVPLMHQGSWYFPISIVFSTIVVSSWIVGLFKTNQFPLIRLCIYVSIVSGYYYFYYHQPGYREMFHWFVMEEAANVSRHYNGKLPKLVEGDDGIVNFALAHDTLSASGFMLDKQGVEEKDRGKLLDLAHARGYSHYASLTYFNYAAKAYSRTQHKDINLASSRDETERLLSKMPLVMLSRNERKTFDFDIVYLSENRQFAILEFKKKQGESISNHGSRKVRQQ